MTNTKTILKGFQGITSKSGKAVLWTFDNELGYGNEKVWLPVSQITILSPTRVEVATWLVKKNGLGNFTEAPATADCFQDAGPYFCEDEADEEWKND